MAWAWAGLALAGTAPVRSAGVEPRVVTEELPPYNMAQGGRITGMSTEVGMAFSLKTSDAVVERFRKSLDAVRRNGTYDAIRRKWQS